MLDAAVATARRALSADVVVAVTNDGSELRPVLAGRPPGRVSSLDALSVNTYLVHASLMGGYRGHLDRLRASALRGVRAR